MRAIWRPSATGPGICCEPAPVDPTRTDRRRACNLVLSLKAVNFDEAVIGHVAFSPVAIEGVSDRFALGPMSIIPLRQSSGIGGALIERGIAILRERGEKGIMLLGEPDSYGRFGFESDPALTYR